MIKKTALLLIKAYKKTTSPLISRGFKGCRFYPTCSDYAHQAIDKKGVLMGGLLTLKRILKCNPFFEGGVDELK